MRTSNLRFVVAATLLTVLAGVGACNCNGSSSDAADQDQDEKAEASSPSAESEQGAESGGDATGEAPPSDLYPGMQFGSLGADARRKFVAVAKREVCPCAEANVSLHKCLQEQSANCAVAKRAATVIARGIKAGLNREDILDKVARFVEEARKEHDFTLENVPHKGPTDAPVRIVEFADFQCPHCKRASELLETIVGEYGDKVVHYFKHFPLSGHGKARMAARASVAAHEQGKFWPMHDLLFEHQRSLSKSKVQKFARRLGLNYSKFKKDMQSQKAKSVVERDRKEGLGAKISGTPAVFINGQRYMGSLQKSGLKDAIDAALAASEQSGSGGPAQESSGSSGD